MRLHLIIQRHGLPVTRILWTTTSSTSLDGPALSYRTAATSSAIASTRAPNALFANGGYSIAQLLEDVNEVIPLETEPSLFGDNRSSGQWGLEDYVVEVAGSECLHFMEVEGLLRDGDVVVIRALQIADLRTRRLSGRHQISMDGKHLIDGVPFGRPYLKRSSSSSRPAISIPPRKKRRTLGSNIGYEEEDTVWAPVEHEATGKEISVLPGAYQEGIDDREAQDEEGDDEDYYEDFHEGQDDEEDSDEEDGEGTVIRHPIAEHEDANISDFEAGDLTEELQGLKEDMHISGLEVGEIDEEQPSRLRSTRSPEQATQEETGAIKSPSQASRATVERSPWRKSVRFSSHGDQASPASRKIAESITSARELVPMVPISSEESASSISSDSDSSDTSSDEDDSASLSNDSTSDSGSSSSTSSASSEDEDEEHKNSALEEVQPTIVNPPGHGSSRTKKSNQRMKLRRRLSKLKEIGILPDQADFTALREWEAANGNWNAGLESQFTASAIKQSKDQEQGEFEAKRQQLLRDLESGGVDVDAFTSQEKAPAAEDVEPEPEQYKEDTAMDDVETGPAKKRSLDVASTRRMLFGSLGVKTPRSKEDEETTRKKLAGKVNNFQSQRKEDQEEEPAEEVEDDMEENWQDKLVIRATECLFDDIELTPPPFPFKQRWDAKAHEIIGQRTGWGRKRKRRQRVQVYDEPEEEEEYWDGYENGYDYENGQYENGELHLNYDDMEQPDYTMDGVEQVVPEISEDAGDDLPTLPDNIGSVPDFAEEELKQGSVIAFKQLDMSKDTNWQPRVSDYRVAEVHEIIEDGIINVRLANRDRRQKKDHGNDEYEDEDEGPRQYSGFEMPGFDDDDEGEDDGFRELAFSELIEPKLLQAVAADAAKGGDAQASNSPVVEDPRPEAVAVEHHSPPGQNVDSQMDGVDDSVNEADESAVNEEHEDNDVEEQGGSPTVNSPKFSGFRSPRSSSKLGEPVETEPPTSKTDAAISQKESNKDTQSSTRGSKHDGSTGNRLPAADDFNDGPTLDSDDMRPLSSHHSLVSFNGLLKKGLKQSNEDSTTNNSPTTKGRQDKKKKRKSERSRRPSSQDSFVPNPFYEIDKAHEEERQRQESERVPDNTIDDLDGLSFTGFSSSPAPAPAPSPRKTRKSLQNKPTARSREESPTSTVPETQWQDNAAQNQDKNSTDYRDTGGGRVKDSANANPTPPPNEAPPASQLSEVVDLTQSSPPVFPDGSDGDFAESQRLPGGPGWVRKNIPKSQRRTRLSSQRVQTLKEVSISPPSSLRWG